MPQKQNALARGTRKGIECRLDRDNDALITETVRSQVLTHRHGIPRHLTGLISALHYEGGRHG